MNKGLKLNHVLTPEKSLQGGFPFSISMIVQPKLHISMARARSGLASFCNAACMTCTAVIRVKKRREGKGTSCIQTYVQLQCEVPPEPSSMDCPSKKDYKIVLQAEYRQGFQYEYNRKKESKRKKGEKNSGSVKESDQRIELKL